MMTNATPKTIATPTRADALAHAQSTFCPECQSRDVIKYGHRKDGAQVFLCKPCEKTFTLPREGFAKGRKFPHNQIGAAIQWFYSGLSTREIQRNMRDVFEIPAPSTATIHEWVTDYTRLAMDKTKDFKAKTGDEWVADEMVVKVGGKNFWLWNVMDSETRYILAARLSAHRRTFDAALVMRQARESAANLPKTIKTDRLRAYEDGIERVFGGDVKHVQSEGIRAEINNNLSERLQGTFRQRTKVLRGLQSRETGQKFLDGWVIHYNYFKPHGSLDTTPAKAAGIDTGFEEWEDFAKLDARPFSETRIRRELRSRKFKKKPVRDRMRKRRRGRL